MARIGTTRFTANGKIRTSPVATRPSVAIFALVSRIARPLRRHAIFGVIRWMASVRVVTTDVYNHNKFEHKDKFEHEVKISCKELDKD